MAISNIQKLSLLTARATIAIACCEYMTAEIAAPASADPGKIIDPCTKQLVDIIPQPSHQPRALDSVKNHDRALYEKIKTKVIDPLYIGESGNITVSTHDKNGNVNGCTFIQNVPYWESGAAARAFVKVNKILAKKGKVLHADPLNGAGRTLAQEESIAWRASGIHAKVGKSNHGFGIAIDFNDDPDPNAKTQIYDDPFVNATLHAHGWRQGDSRGPIKNDLHHWSFVGPAPAKDGIPGT
ncbi:MAG TPA: hypothetical protein V6C89_08665 [Drouetiella sp.]|jgi:hypothetical protein